MKLPINDYLIAEIGGNHEGNIEWALQMIGDAAAAGANAVKFQSYSASELVNSKLDKTRFDHFNNFILNDKEWSLLKEKALSCGVDFLTSIWDIEGFREIMDDGAYYFNPYSVDDIIDKLEKILLSSSLKKDLVLRASERVSNFSWEKCSNATLKIYKE